MRSVVVVLIALLLPSITVRAGPYEDCILKNMKGVTDRLAAVEVKRACERKSVPEKCRGRLATPTLNEWLEAARAKNPGVSDAELYRYWDRVYGPGIAQSGSTADDSDRQSAQIKEQAAKQRCIDACKTASWWERTFGDCRTG